jgi:hypothetical protein
MHDSNLAIKTLKKDYKKQLAQKEELLQEL